MRTVRCKAERMPLPQGGKCKETGKLYPTAMLYGTGFVSAYCGYMDLHDHADGLKPMEVKYKK